LITLGRTSVGHVRWCLIQAHLARSRSLSESVVKRLVFGKGVASAH